MENNSQSNPQVSTPSTHSEGKVLMIAVLMFIFGGVMGNMIPGMPGSQQKGASLDSQSDYGYLEERNSVDDQKNTQEEKNGLFSAITLPSISVQGLEKLNSTSIGTGSMPTGGAIDRPYTCSWLDGSPDTGVDIDSNDNFVVITDQNGNVIGTCVPTN